MNGVSNKIASLFLRDVALKYNLVPEKGRIFLQPVDTWILRVIREISGHEEFQYWHCADYLVNNAPEPEKTNQGIWHLCADPDVGIGNRILTLLDSIDKIRQTIDKLEDME